QPPVDSEIDPSGTVLSHGGKARSGIGIVVSDHRRPGALCHRAGIHQGVGLDVHFPPRNPGHRRGHVGNLHEREGIGPFEDGSPTDHRPGDRVHRRDRHAAGNSRRSLDGRRNHRLLAQIVHMDLAQIGSKKRSVPLHTPFSGWILHARETYSPLRVSMMRRSPSWTNKGTWTTNPVSSLADLLPPVAVSPLMPGSVSTTSSSTV